MTTDFWSDPNRLFKAAGIEDNSWLYLYGVKKLKGKTLEVFENDTGLFVVNERNSFNCLVQGSAFRELSTAVLLILLQEIATNKGPL